MECLSSLAQWSTTAPGFQVVPVSSFITRSDQILPLRAPNGRGLRARSPNGAEKNSCADIMTPTLFPRYTAATPRDRSQRNSIRATARIRWPSFALLAARGFGIRENHVSYLTESVPVSTESAAPPWTQVSDSGIHFLRAPLCITTNLGLIRMPLWAPAHITSRYYSVFMHFRRHTLISSRFVAHGLAAPRAHPISHN